MQSGSNNFLQKKVINHVCCSCLVQSNFFFKGQVSTTRLGKLNFSRPNLSTKFLRLKSCKAGCRAFGHRALKFDHDDLIYWVREMGGEIFVTNWNRMKIWANVRIYALGGKSRCTTVRRRLLLLAFLKTGRRPLTKEIATSSNQSFPHPKIWKL